MERSKDVSPVTVQRRVNELDTRQRVAVLYFYKVEPRTMSDAKLMLYREIYGWGI